MAHSSKRSAASGRTPLIVLALAGVVAVAGLLVGYHHQKPTREQLAQQISLGATADSQLYVVGTLAPLGSFEYETSPLLTSLAVKKRHAATAFLQHAISRDQASEVQADGDSAYAVIAQATRVCNPSLHSGKCRGPRAKVDELLAEARHAVQAVPDYPPGVSYTSR